MENESIKNKVKSVLYVQLNRVAKKVCLNNFKWLDD